MQNQIIEFLKRTENYFSGEELSQQLKISRAGIWKNIEELRKEGYHIEAVPHLGYRLIATPDKLIPREIQHGLKAKVFGRRIVYHETIASTMDEAFRLGLEGAPEGTVVVAEQQTKGKGRLGRKWISPKGKGIYMSIIVRPNLSPMDTTKLTLMSAEGVCQAVNQYAGGKAKIKWPNDVLVNSHKLAGILTELSAEMDRVRFIVIGVGINVNTALAALPARATSLRIEAKKQISRIELIKDVLYRLEKLYMEVSVRGFSSIIEQWKDFSSTLGKRVRIDDVEGEVIGLDENGGLMIRNHKGIIVKRMTGDVVYVG